MGLFGLTSPLVPLVNCIQTLKVFNRTGCNPKPKPNPNPNPYLQFYPNVEGNPNIKLADLGLPVAPLRGHGNNKRSRQRFAIQLRINVRVLGTMNSVMQSARHHEFSHAVSSAPYSIPIPTLILNPILIPNTTLIPNHIPHPHNGRQRRLHQMAAAGLTSVVRCALSDRNVHSRMPLDPTHVRLKNTHATNGIPLGRPLPLTR
jgi:hypothetical protein